MSTRCSLWLGLSTGFAGSAALLLLARPPAVSQAPATLALPVGALAGVALFAGIERRLPRVPAPPVRGRRVWLAKYAVLLLWAAVEETFWRWFVLAEAVRAVPPAAALAAVSVAFAASHRAHRRLHVATGLALGAAFLAGGLAAAWAAHAAYNVSVSATAEQRRREVRP